MKKLFALILAAIMICACFASCMGGSDLEKLNSKQSPPPKCVASFILNIPSITNEIRPLKNANEEKITIMTRKGYVTVLGKKLVLSVFEGRFAEICGIIHNVGVGDGSL